MCFGVGVCACVHWLSIAAPLDLSLIVLSIVVLLYCLTISSHRLLEISPCPRGPLAYVGRMRELPALKFMKILIRSCYQRHLSVEAVGPE